MQKSKLLFILVVCMTSMAEAQTLFSKEIQGKVVAKDEDVAAVHVQNISTKRATITDLNGYFTIKATVNDTLVISAVQFKRKEIVVSTDMLQSSLLQIPLEESLTELDEVVVMPYNLSGDISKDLNTLKTEEVVTASTLGLPNAYVIPISKADRELFEATTGGGIPLNPIINGISGRTKMLKNRIKRNEKYERTQRVRAFYVDSLFTTDLKIPQLKISDFMYFCEVDSSFSTIVDTHDHLKIWEFLHKKSVIYRKENNID
ncbi:carboxypeptidase-like regulatory domain-containing protein [uncultured Maribacter sp.]|uniref:carboxypeptidase-like regulatory domain-containing protein n=1 Tax=uncultured Maribacter sp. TaxID=431308 RepID=UPI00260E7A8D|nr:carboxypeptidase-like regulatory domain-containing protein [uncultured Maribacter sp.]